MISPHILLSYLINIFLFIISMFRSKNRKQIEIKTSGFHNLALIHLQEITKHRKLLQKTMWTYLIGILVKGGTFCYAITISIKIRLCFIAERNQAMLLHPFMYFIHYVKVNPFMAKDQIQMWGMISTNHCFFHVSWWILCFKATIETKSAYIDIWKHILTKWYWFEHLCVFICGCVLFKSSKTFLVFCSYYFFCWQSWNHFILHRKNVSVVTNARIYWTLWQL